MDARERARHRYHLVREAAIKALGGKCVRCGFSDKRALQFDHVEACGAGRKQTMELCYDVLHAEATGIQLLCANCNFIKRWEQAEVPLRGPVVRQRINVKARTRLPRPQLRLGEGNA